MTDRDRQLDRLAKLVALESSPNAHEASAARRSAERLMKKYGLRREDVAGRESSGYCERPMGARGFAQAWRFALVTAAARHCGCEAVGLLVGRRRKVRICGERADVERAARLYSDLLAAVLELGRGYSTSPRAISPRMRAEAVLHGARACVDSYRRGAVLGIVERLARLSGGPLFRGRGPAHEGEPAPGGAAPGQSLARTGRRGREQSERARSRYSAEEQDVGLDDFAAGEWFLAGARAAIYRVRVGESLEVVVESEMSRRHDEEGKDS